MAKKKTNTKQIAILSAAAVLLVALSAGASVYLTKESIKNKSEKVAVTTHHKSVKNDIKWDNKNQNVQTQQVAQSNCDDGNIAGKAVGGVGGGVLGSMVGKGKGKTAATIGGTLGGAYLGGEAIPLRNVTCRQ